MGEIAPSVIIRKRVRMKQKDKEYEHPTTEQLVGHFIAEVGKMAHAWWHSHVYTGPKHYPAQAFKEAFVDVSNLHDMLLERAKKEWG